MYHRPLLSQALDIERSIYSTIKRPFQAEDVDIQLPKFAFEAQYDLKKPLSDWIHPMDIIFDGNRADFSGINGHKGLFVSKVLHKAKIVVDEEGTEAAAATEVEAIPESMVYPEPIQFNADHPFLFYIVDKISLEMLFIGSVSEL